MPQQKIPPWIKKRVGAGGECRDMRRLLGELSVNTVCESALCPNIYECFCKNYASFMILGNRCTRGCRFCGVTPLAESLPPDAGEPERIALAVKRLGMNYAVITSPTRDDLPDGGAGQFAETTVKIRSLTPGTKIELLIPDFKGKRGALEKIFASMPDVISHNMETVPSLYPSVRPSADYDISMGVLRDICGGGFTAKSGFMLGLGEKREEVLGLMRSIRDTGCSYLIIGQYLKPSKKALPVAAFIAPETFEEYRRDGLSMGFKNVFAGTFYRSSFMAEKLIR